MELADNLASLAQQGAWVLWLDRETGEPISEPTRDPERVRQDWHAHRHYSPRAAIAATKRNPPVQQPANIEAWWPPKNWRPGTPLLSVPLKTAEASPAALAATVSKKLKTTPASIAPLRATASGEPEKPTPTPQQTPQWVSVHQASGEPLSSFSNAIEYLRACCGEQLWLNAMTGVVMLHKEGLGDAAVGKLRDQAERLYGVRFSPQTLGEAALVIADDRRRNPVREYLHGLKWDGTARLEQLAARLCRSEPSELDRAVVRCFAVQAIARALHPGCKADSVLILCGPQRSRKSSALRTLAGEFFSDGELPDNARDQGQLLRLGWIHELAEADRYIKSRDSSTLKAMITRQEDAYRPPYARSPIVVPRAFVLTGTVNGEEFLIDGTGNRRFWILATGSCIDVDWIEEHRDQLWAEAFAAHQAGEAWWLEEELERQSAERNTEYLVRDELDDLVAQAVDGKDTTTVLEVCIAVLSRGLTGEAAIDQASLRARSDKSLQNRVGAAMNRCGWQRQRRRVEGKPSWVWTRKD